MKKLASFVITGVLMFATAACGGGTSTSEAPDSTAAPGAAKEAASKTDTAAKDTTSTTKTAAQDAAKKTDTATKTAAQGGAAGAKTIAKNKLAEKIPGSKLDVTEKDGVLTVTGTVPTEADLKKIEPTIKEYKFKDVKSVKVEAKVAPKAQ